MRKASYYLLMSCICVTFSLGTAHAEWPTDPSVNLQIAGGAGEQTTPIIRATSDGGFFVAYYSNASGNYDVYLQRLNALGEVMWVNGLLVSDNPMTSYITVWDFEVDNQDNAILATNDVRTGDDWDIYGYSISPTGEFNWGENGITLSADDESDVAQHIQPTSDGGVVFAWQGSTASYNVGYMRKVDANGDDAWEPSTVAITAEYHVQRLKMAPTSDGGVIVAFLKYTGPNVITSPSHLYVQRYDANGVAQWAVGGVGVATQGGIGPAAHPDLVSDGEDGAIIYWYDSHESNQHHAYVQRITSGGTLAWGGGSPVRASLMGGQLEMSPTIAYDNDNEYTYIFYTIANTAQSQWGVGAQRFNALGERQWSDNGLALVPLGGEQPSLLSGTALPMEGAVVSYLQHVPGSAVNSYTKAIRVDASGSQVWAQSPTVMSNVVSEKGHLTSSVNHLGQVVVVWKDSRNGTPDLFVQNVNPDGSFGPYGEPGPALTIDWPGEGDVINQVPFSMNYTATGFVVAEEGGDGRLLVEVVGSSSGFGFETAEASVVIDALELGSNTITLELIDNEGQSLVPPVTASVTVIHALPSLLITSPEDGAEVSEQIVMVTFEVDNFELGIEADGYVALRLNDGDPLYLDEQAPQAVMLVEGENGIILELVDGDHEPLDPPVVASVYVTYQPSGVGEGDVRPSEYALAEVYPNPFNPSTSIRFAMREAGRVRLTVFDTLGREVAVLLDERRAAGMHSLSYEASGLASGLYFLRMTTEQGFSATRKLVRMK